MKFCLFSLNNKPKDFNTQWKFVVQFQIDPSFVELLCIDKENYFRISSMKPSWPFDQLNIDVDAGCGCCYVVILPSRRWQASSFQYGQSFSVAMVVALPVLPLHTALDLCIRESWYQWYPKHLHIIKPPTYLKILTSKRVSVNVMSGSGFLLVGISIIR